MHSSQLASWATAVVTVHRNPVGHLETTSNRHDARMGCQDIKFPKALVLSIVTAGSPPHTISTESAPALLLQRQSSMALPPLQAKYKPKPASTQAPSTSILELRTCSGAIPGLHHLMGSQKGISLGWPSCWPCSLSNCRKLSSSVLSRGFGICCGSACWPSLIPKRSMVTPPVYTTRASHNPLLYSCSNE